MPDLARPLQECLQAMAQRRNLHEVLRRYPVERDELIALLQLSVDLSSLSAPAADPAFRLRTRNRMLAAATRQRQVRSWNSLRPLSRRMARLIVAGAGAATLALGGVTAAAASERSLPGDPLYGVKLGLEQAQLTTTFDPAGRARLQLRFASNRLAEARRLIAAGRLNDGIQLINRYDAAVAQFNQSTATSAFDTRAVAELSRAVADREAEGDASLKELAGSLAAGGHEEAAAAVSQTRSRIDQSWRGSRQNLQAHSEKGDHGRHDGSKPPGEEP